VLQRNLRRWRKQRIRIRHAKVAKGSEGVEAEGVCPEAALEVLNSLLGAVRPLADYTEQMEGPVRNGGSCGAKETVLSLLEVLQLQTADCPEVAVALRVGTLEEFKGCLVLSTTHVHLGQHSQRLLGGVLIVKDLG